MPVAVTLYVPAHTSANSAHIIAGSVSHVYVTPSVSEFAVSVVVLIVLLPSVVHVRSCTHDIVGDTGLLVSFVITTLADAGQLFASSIIDTVYVSDALSV